MGYPVVEAPAGALRGRDDGRVSAWLGIRYGEPPTGERRWRAPVAAAPWSGVREALVAGPAAPQRPNPAVPLGDGAVIDEDCLFLNVWRRSRARPAEPAAASAASAPLKPVMVWLHGGAYTFGSSTQPIYDGTTLVTAGDVVLVTVNHRLGALGFLDLRSVATAADPFDANPALRDVLLALHWVQENIRSFGGDPGRVTVFGESSGAGMVTALLATPSAAGLFHRAIAQSSPVTSMYGADRAAAVARAFLTAAGVSPARPEGLRLLSASAVVDAAATVFADVPRDHPGRLPFSPVVDGDILPEHPITVLSSGRGLPVPLIIGTNRDEATLFKFMRSPLMPITRDALEQMFQQMREEDPDAVAPSRDQVLTAYQDVRERALGLGIATDIAFRMPTIWAAAGHSAVAPTYLYRFDYATPLLKALGIGASHATELPYVWGNLDALRLDPSYGFGGRARALALSRRMQYRWTSFAHGAGPGADWRPYTVADRATLVIDRRDRLVADADAALRAGWGEAVVSFQ